MVKEVSGLQTLNEDKKLKIYRKLREQGVKLGKKVHYLPDNLDLQISLDDYGMLHFPVLILYDEFM